MRMIKSYVVWMLVGILGLSVVAWAGPTVIKVWESEGYGLEAVEQTIESLVPGIDLQISQYPYNELRMKLSTTLATGDPSVAPDIVMVDSIWLGEFVEGSYLANLSNVVAKEAADWFPAFRNGSQWPAGSGKYYGIWYDTDVRATLYWPDLLQKAGVNPGDLLYWDTCIPAVKKLNDALAAEGIGGFRLDMGGSYAADFFFYPLLWSEGGDILSTVNGKLEPAFNSEAGVRALQFLVDLVKKAGVEPQMQCFWGNDWAARKWAVYIHGNWATSASRFPGTTAQEREQKVAVLPYPVSEPGKVPVTLSGGWIMTIPAILQQKAPDRFAEACKVLQAFLRTDVMAKYDSALARIPVRAALMAEPYKSQLAKNIEFFNFYSKMASIARVRPAIPQWNQVADAVFEAMQKAIFQGVNPKQALDNAAAKVRSILGS